MSADLIPMRVAAIRDIAPTLRHVVLAARDGRRLPAASAGAHVQLHLRCAGGRRVNAYSLVNAPGHDVGYEIIVRRVPASRGGSAHVHEHLAVGDTLDVALPCNLFAPVRTARHHLMIAGGIGITPFLSYLREFGRWSVSHALHLCCREEERHVFDPWLPASGTVTRHWEAPGAMLDLPALLAGQRAGTALYVCGPQAMIDQVRQAAAGQGWPAELVLAESFGGAAPGEPFRAVLRRSGVTVDVGADESLLEAIERAGIDTPSMCRGGACGMCELPVLDGQPDHRDHFLDAARRDAGTCIMPCVSRARTASLVIDL